MLSKEEIEDSIESKFNNSEEENFELTIEEAKHIALYEKEIHYCDALTQATYNVLLKYIEQLETINDKYLQKLVYALTPTTHTLGTTMNNAFKQIIAENIDLETCKIRRKLKEFWGIDKY